MEKIAYYIPKGEEYIYDKIVEKKELEGRGSDSNTVHSIVKEYFRQQEVDQSRHTE